MLDIHSHILPAIDDGAKTLEISKELLVQMFAQNVTTAVATPHFYPGSMSLEDFLLKRQDSYEKLVAFIGEDFPVKILLGSEVLYFKNIGKMSDVSRLTLASSRYLLLELLGLKSIDESVVKDISNLKYDLGITPIIAHTERYRNYKGYKKLLSLFKEGTALCQVNASFALSLSEKHAARRLLKAGLISFVASDCHNPSVRPVRLEGAFSEIRKFSPLEADRILKLTEQTEKELLSL